MKDLEGEIWKDIQGYEGLYQISNKGRVKSLHYKVGNKEEILKPHSRKEYYAIGLFKNGKQHHYGIHRLVAIAFIPNPNNLPIVNHKDINQHNNCVENLEWCTAQYNSTYADAIEKRVKKMSGKKHFFYGKKHSDEFKRKVSNALKKYYKNNPNPMLGKKGALSPSSKKVVQLSKEGDFIKEWDSIIDVERSIKIECRNISAVCRGKRKTCGGYKWMFSNIYYM